MLQLALATALLAQARAAEATTLVSKLRPSLKQECPPDRMPAASVGGHCFSTPGLTTLKELPAQCVRYATVDSLMSYYTQKNISDSNVRARAKGDLSALRSLYGSDVSRYW